MITQIILFGIRLLTIVTAPIRAETPLVVGAEALGPIEVEGAELLAMLHAAHAGEDPAMLFAELYANSGSYSDVDEDEGLF